MEKKENQEWKQLWGVQGAMNLFKWIFACGCINALDIFSV